MKEKKISVIIAAYNAERFLDQTMAAILDQSMDKDDYEVIIINDGSTDHTLDILCGYQRTYDSVRIIDKENGGPSSARNAGLDIAVGKFVYFLDADDIPEHDALESLYNVAIGRSADLVIANYDIIDQYHTIEITNLDELVQKEDINTFDPDILWTFALWNKLFVRTIIEDNHLRFYPISYSEDGVFLMQYIFHCKRITGLDKIILHYRRYSDGTSDAITASISSQKIRDYITAHQMIENSIYDAILAKFPGCSCVKEAIDQDENIHRYVNVLYRKELQILIDRFYSEFWGLSQSDRDIITEEICRKLSLTDLDNVADLTVRFPFMVLPGISSQAEELLQNAYFTFVLYGTQDEADEFGECLSTLCKQNMVFYKIILPSSMRHIVDKKYDNFENIIYLNESVKSDFYHEAMDTADTPYIMFCSPRMRYVNNILRIAFPQASQLKPDIIIHEVYHNDFGEVQPTALSRIFHDIMSSGWSLGKHLCLDATLGNKFLSLAFLQEFFSDASFESEEICDQLYAKGSCYHYDKGSVVFHGTDEEYTEFIATEKSRNYILSCLEEAPSDLSCPDLMYNPGKSALKFVTLREGSKEFFLKEKGEKYTKQHMWNRVLFLSIRGDGRLEGNARALRPYIKGRKVVYAKMLPHDERTALKMAKLVFTSKVIITDDYVKYLRYFPLRPEQRVIQLWHACGAFKKFGQRGTNLPLETDLATHAQYNLVCVSGEKVRSIYADAFDVELKKVKALGSPRTDAFFDRKYLNSIRRKIYSRHPEFCDKSIIVYAPTFRDGGDRAEFHPEIDFDKLSDTLLPDQVFVICPHPVMKNDIVDKAYPNIRVLRDFSTNDYMIVSDKLITDYSSVIFEYALLDKPIGFYCYDLNSYNRGFYLRYPEDLPGDIYTSQDELERFLCETQDNLHSEKRKQFVEKYMTACDGHSAERIAAIVNAYMER